MCSVGMSDFMQIVEEQNKFVAPDCGAPETPLCVVNKGSVLGFFFLLYVGFQLVSF